MKISLWLKHVPVKGTLNYAIDMITLLNQCNHCNKSFPETVQRFLKTCVKLKKKDIDKILNSRTQHTEQLTVQQ